MSEWVSVLVVFWILWALDGLRLLPRRVFTVIGCGLKRRGRVGYSRLSLPGFLPSSCRVTAADVPLVLSPLGVSNQPAGSAGRPAESSPSRRVWRWEDVREVGVAKGSIFINGTLFCADSGHVRAAELLRLAQASPSDRERKIETLLRVCFRPAHLRRRAVILGRRTMLATWLNGIAFAGLVAITVYVVGDVASRLPARWSERLVEALPWIMLGLLVLHVAAVVSAWMATRRLRVPGPDKRAAALFSALLLPPQALRLRSIVGDGFFPAAHPAAALLALARQRAAEEYAFNTVADLRWPLETVGQPQDLLSEDISAWYRERLGRILEPHLAAAGFPIEKLLSTPRPDSPASRSYCPRCRDQFVERAGFCPNSVQLCPLPSQSVSDGEDLRHAR